jgi:preprotein translocase subunit SecE
MARNTRQQRRRRRERRQEATTGTEQQGAKQQGVSQRARARQQQVRPAQQPPKTQTGRRGGGGRRFISESAAELRKVEWPTQRQVLTGTVVVIIACAIVGTYLWLADLALQPFVERLLLGQ